MPICRDKEEKQDYRYMPEPNLLPLNLLELKLHPSDFRARIPVLPEQQRTVLMNKYQLSLETTIQLVVTCFTYLLLMLSNNAPYNPKEVERR